jgi:L-rhamnose mutarotase
MSAWIAGCDAASTAYYLSGADSRLSPELYTLTPKDKDKQVRVAVMVYAGMVAEPQLITADREVTLRTIRALREVLHEPKEKERVIFVSAHQLAEYKEAHPDWRMNLVDAGKHFHADYVIYMDLEGMSLFESKSYNQVLHAHADVQLKLFDMKEPDDPIKEKDFRCEYPRTAPVPVEDRRLDEFRNSFYDEIATRICWMFAKHETPSSF